MINPLRILKYLSSFAMHMPDYDDNTYSEEKFEQLYTRFTHEVYVFSHMATSECCRERYVEEFWEKEKQAIEAKEISVFKDTMQQAFEWRDN